MPELDPSEGHLELLQKSLPMVGRVVRGTGGSRSLVVVGVVTRIERYEDFRRRKDGGITLAWINADRPVITLKLRTGEEDERWLDAFEWEVAQ